MKATAPHKPAYTIKEAALYLNISTKSVRRLIDRKLLRTSKALAKVMILGDDVETLYERTC